MTSAGKQSTVVTAILGTLLAAVLTAPSLSGQEDAALPVYLFMTEASIAQEDVGNWANAVTVLARAHAKHPKGSSWATYRRLTGGPEEAVRTLFPLSRMGDLDNWMSNRQIVTEILGKDQARTVLTDLDLSIDTNEQILSHSEKLSHPEAPFKAFQYVWVIEVRVEEGKMTEYAALARRLAEMQRENRAGTWMVYGSALGGEQSTLFYFYGFDKFAEVDGWPSRLEVAAESLGASEAAQLLAALDAVSQTTTSLWQLEPQLSQLEVK